MSGTRRRLGALETVWKRSTHDWRRRFDPGRLTDDERREYAGLDRRRAAVGLAGLTDAEVERGAELAEKMRDRRRARWTTRSTAGPS
jgi:hypothetical protein